jgi:hypothetical protein
MADTMPALDNIFAREGDAMVRIKPGDGLAAQDFWLQAHSEIGLVTIDNMEVTKAWKDGKDGKTGAIEKLVFKCKTTPETLTAVETECKRRGVVVSMKGRGKEFPIGKVLRDEIKSTEPDEYGLKLSVCKNLTKYAAAFRKAGRASFIDPSGTDWTERLLVKREDCADEFIEKYEGKKMKLVVKCYGVSRAMNFMWQIVSVRPMEEAESGNKKRPADDELLKKLDSTKKMCIAKSKELAETKRSLAETNRSVEELKQAVFDLGCQVATMQAEQAKAKKAAAPAAAAPAAPAPALTGKRGPPQLVSS